MTGEQLPKNPVSAAMAARDEYLDMGPAEPLGCLPEHDLMALTSATEGVAVPTHASYDIGWLELETAVAVHNGHPDRDWNPHFEPLALVQRARKRWEDIYENPANPASLRSWAHFAVGHLALYLFDETKPAMLDVDSIVNHQFTGAQLMLRAFDRYKDLDLTHDLHCQTIMYLLSCDYSHTLMIGAPSGPRFQRLGDDRSHDILLRVDDDEDNSVQIHFMKVTSQEGGIMSGSLTLPPRVLLNQGYEPKLGHGTLRALLETSKVARMISGNRNLSRMANPGRLRNLDRQNKHVETVRNNVTSALLELLEKGRYGKDLSIDPVGGLGEARQQYAGLSPNYRFISEDEGWLTSCINAHEYALGGEATSEDAVRLGWLHMELSALPDEGDNYDRAVQVFEAAAEQAEEQQNWPIYLEAMIGKATAGIHRHMQGETVTEEQAAEYRWELVAIAEGLVRGLGAQEAGPHAARLQALIPALAACLSVNTDPELLHIATFPAPRQAAGDTEIVGSDLLIHPQLQNDGEFNIFAAGKVRFDGKPRNTLDFGVATVTATALAKLGWRDNLAMLQRCIAEAYRQAEDPDAFTPDTAIENVRNHLLSAAADTLRV